MKNSPLTSILLAVLAISAAWSVISCMQYISNTREIRELQARLAAVQYRQNAFQALLYDTGNYSKTHPAIDPILESIGIRRPAKTAPTATTK